MALQDELSPGADDFVAESSEQTTVDGAQTSVDDEPTIVDDEPTNANDGRPTPSLT